MIVNAYQTAFHRGEGPVKIRSIEIPNEEIGGLWRTRHDPSRQRLLDRAFYYGQNDFQPVQDRYSVSVGDVIQLPDGGCYRVLGAGFEELPADEDPKALVGREANRAGYGF